MARTPAKTGQKSGQKTGRKKSGSSKKAAARTKSASRPSPAKLVIARRGLMLVLSSPSGAGKTTLSRMLLKHDPGVELSISVTTRPRRRGEVDGRDYHFITLARFDA